MQTTANSQAFIESEVVSNFILHNLHDGLLGEQFYRNVSDFGNGTTLNIKTVGSVTIQDAQEDTPLVYNPIETGTVTLQITTQEGDAWYITDDLREDGNQVDALISARAMEGTRAIQESFETKFLATANAAQTNANANVINGFAHRIASAETNNVFALDQLIRTRLAFDKANVPAQGRVFICDPVVEATLNGLVTITHDVTPFGAEILQKGLASGMRFIMTLFGFDIILSNRLATGSFSDGTTTVANGVANVAMCVLDDQTKPIMVAWRRQPKTESERNKDLARDEFVTRCRYGMGPQRLDTLAIIITSAVNI
ncbi:putative major capsid protein [Citrobacter phage CVT22]|uniref:Major capsid protein n=1 Tax=Citrobacter phage CVT22 TaxID=1622234 RepID=A0A0R6BQ39_9CAUD|nr:putative major capsid protein [Citrobacter phage CVT22]AJT60712.1 putative major capsid protein [Citrobacter phage CVT22]